MSREIKFRIWDKKYSTFDYNGSPELFISTEGEVFEKDERNYGMQTYTEYNRSDFYEISQFTGLHDKNGTPIYESDIVKITGEQEFDVGYSCQMKDNAIVKWDVKECGFFLDVIKKRRVNFSDFESTSIDTFPLRKWEEEEWWIEYEVIGNIHEGVTE